MTKNKERLKRSWLTTAVAATVGLTILCVSTMILPLSGIAEGVTFGIGLLLVVLCAVVAYEGKKSAIKELIYSLTFWR